MEQPGSDEVDQVKRRRRKAGQVLEIALAGGQSRQPRRRPELSRRQREHRGQRQHDPKPAPRS